MKKLFTVIMMVLGLNLLAVAGGVGYLFQSGKIDRQKVLAIREMLFPPPLPDPATTQPADDPTTRPASARLADLLARKTGMSTGEQVDFLQQTFDSQTALLDRHRREVDDLQRQVELAKQQVARDRAAVDADRAKLDAEQKEAARLASDQGFQDSLALYQAMPSRQVKSIFMSLDDEIVTQYLQAMGPGGSKKILKEFKSAEELARVQSIMERMRLSEASLKE
jgi:hypothetical protein